MFRVYFQWSSCYWLPMTGRSLSCHWSSWGASYWSSQNLVALFSFLSLIVLFVQCPCSFSYHRSHVDKPCFEFDRRAIDRKAWPWWSLVTTCPCVLQYSWHSHWSFSSDAVQKLESLDYGSHSHVDRQCSILDIFIVWIIFSLDWLL